MVIFKAYTRGKLDVNKNFISETTRKKILWRPGYRRKLILPLILKKQVVVWTNFFQGLIVCFPEHHIKCRDNLPFNERL
jgi:hypothetical protein